MVPRPSFTPCGDICTPETAFLNRPKFSRNLSDRGIQVTQDVNTSGGCYRNSQELHLSICTIRREKEVGKLMSSLLKTELCILHVFQSLESWSFSFEGNGRSGTRDLLVGIWSPSYEAWMPLPNESTCCLWGLSVVSKSLHGSHSQMTTLPYFSSLTVHLSE